MPRMSSIWTARLLPRPGDPCRAELRHERDEARRDDDNAALAWLNVTGKRLGWQLAKALGLDDAGAAGWDRLLVVERRTSIVSLKPDLVLSDVQVFVSAAVRAVEPSSEGGPRRAAPGGRGGAGARPAPGATAEPAGVDR
jgi:hypothetical protein